MILGLVRHGIAEDMRGAVEDADRRLTDKGQKRTRMAMQGLARFSVDWSRILTSPYIRAVETAEIAVEQLDLKISPEHLDHLTPFGDPHEVLKALGKEPATSALCFGHAPNLDRVLAAALGFSSPFTRLKKAGVAVLDVDLSRPGSSLLYSLLPPRVLRDLT